MSEMARARASDKHGERSVACWQRYERGLRRQYHGDKFGTPQEHALWLSLADDGSDPSSRERGQSYRDGLAAKWQGYARTTVASCSMTPTTLPAFDPPDVLNSRFCTG
jgi:hypothetical protein